MKNSLYLNFTLYKLSNIMVKLYYNKLKQHKKTKKYADGGNGSDNKAKTAGCNVP